MNRFGNRGRGRGGYRQYDNAGPGRGGHRFNQYPNRRMSGGGSDHEQDEAEREAGSNDIEKRLESLISRLGEKSSASLENNIRNLAKVLSSDIANYKDTILSILLKCATSMPEKITIYTSLAGVLNVDNYAFGGEFVEGLARRFQATLQEPDFSQAELTLRVIADCANCNLISLSSLINSLESLLEVTFEKNIPQARSDWYTYAVLSCLPWIGEKLSFSRADDLKKLLDDIVTYTSRRKLLHVNALKIIKSDDPLPQEDYIDSLWNQIDDLKNRQWREKHITRPYNSLEPIVSRGQAHNLPKLNPAVHEEESVYPLPQVVFRLFDYTDCPEGSALPPMNSIERFLIEDDLKRVIVRHCEDRRQCAALLLNYPTVQVNIPLDYVVTEVMLGQLMQLPKSPYKQIMYGSTILELCKVRQDVMLQTLALAVSLLYERIDNLNISCLHRLASWFAYHLSNYDYRWTWDDWSDCLGVDKDHPKAKFVSEVFQNCIRMAYHERIADTAPQRFKVFLPETPYLERKFDVENPETVAGCQQAIEVHQEMMGKKDPVRISEIIRSVPKPDTAAESEFNPLQIDVFVHIVLGLSAKTFTHLFAALTKFTPVIRDLLSSEQEQIYFLQSIFDLFQNREYTLITLIDRLLRMQLIEPAGVVNWIFSPAMKPHFSRYFLWEILQQTIHRVSSLVERCRTELTEAKNRTEETVEADAEPKDEEILETLEEAYDRSLSQQKSMFLVIFQRFVMAFTDYLEQPGSKAKATESLWWKTAIGNMQFILMTNFELIRPYNTTLEKLVFTKEIDKAILHAYNEYAAMLS